MKRMLRVTPLIKRPKEGLYKFSYGKVRGELQFTAQKSDSEKEWKGVTAIQLPVSRASPEDWVALQELNHSGPEEMMKSGRLERVNFVFLGAASKPLTPPGPPPRIPLQATRTFYPSKTAGFHRELTHDLNEELCRFYDEHTLVEDSYEVACGVQVGEENGLTGPSSFTTIFYVFGPREKKSRRLASLKNPLDIELLPAAQQLARKTLLRIQKKPI